MKWAKALGLILAVFVLAIPAGYAQDSIEIPGIEETTGTTRLVLAPRSVGDNFRDGSAVADIFIEHENLTLASSVLVDIRVSGSSRGPGSIPGGQSVNSYFINRETANPLQNSGPVQGTITFEQEILGVILGDTSLESSTRLFAAVDTRYTELNGLELTSVGSITADKVSVSSNARTITFVLNNSVDLDQIRVITRQTGAPSSNNGSGSSGPGDGDDASSLDLSDLSATTSQNRSVSVTVFEDDLVDRLDIDRDSFRVADSPDNGRASVDQDDGSIVYRPDSGFSGTDRFVYELCDNGDNCDTATVTITVIEGSSGSGGDDDGSRVTLGTLLPAAENCSFADTATLDIVPGNDENIIRLDDGRGLTPVAIVSSEFFPAANCVDVSTIRFGPAGNELEPLSCGAVEVGTGRDEEFIDVLCDFRTSDLDFTLDDNMGRLTAETILGERIDISDAVDVREERRPRNRISQQETPSFSVQQVHVGRNVLIAVNDHRAARIDIQVLSLSGERIHQSSSTGSMLRWSMRASNGQPLANGIYFTLVSVFDSKGLLIGHKLNKLVILR